MHCNLVPRAFPLKNGCSGIKQENVNIYIVRTSLLNTTFISRFVRSPYSGTILMMTFGLNFKRLLQVGFTPSGYMTLGLASSASDSDVLKRGIPW